MHLFIRQGRTFLLAAVVAVVAICVSYGGEPTGTSGSSTFTDKRDGKKYKTVIIGGKTWMAQNLNYQTGKSMCYDNDKSNCNKYGRLYDWKTAKSACPNGWRLSSSQDWDDLVTAAGGDVAGKALKSLKYWKDNGNGEDIYGFSALPGGTYTIGADEDGFELATSMGFWLMGDIDTMMTEGQLRMMYYNDVKVQIGVDESGYYSVRCVQK